MTKSRYTPFLKVKANEVGAVAALKAEVRVQITPFFDLPRKDDMTEATFSAMVFKAAKKFSRYLADDLFYLDNLDIPDDIRVGGKANYGFVIQEFSEITFIPVIGLDRTLEHNDEVFSAKKNGLVKSGRVAIRLLEEDFEDFDLVYQDLHTLIASASSVFDEMVLVLDCRVCLNLDPEAHASKLASFIDAAINAFEFAEVIVTGSSIPASISDVAKAQQQGCLDRIELDIYRRIKTKTAVAALGLGDYTIVSPMYSELSLPGEMMRNVTAPKVLYTFDDVHYVARGGALKTHARGNLQYNDIAADIVAKPFFRHAPYSYGDNFLVEKAKGQGNQVTPGSILKPTINAHITYMATGHSLVV